MTESFRLSPLQGDQALASLDDLKADLSIDGTASDTTLTRYLLDASSAVLAYIGRPILRAQWRDIVIVREGQRLMGMPLGALPVLSLDAITRNGSDWDADDIAACQIDNAAGLVFPPRWAFWPPGRYVIAYQAGYELADSAADPPVIGTLPRPVGRAVLLTAAAAYHAAARGDPMLRSESEQGVGSTSWTGMTADSGGLPPEAAALLDRQFFPGVA